MLFFSMQMRDCIGIKTNKCKRFIVGGGAYVNVCLLFLGKASPIVAMIMVPLIGALIVGFGMNDIQTFFEQGIFKVLPVATIFIFAIL